MSSAESVGRVGERYAGGELDARTEQLVSEQPLEIVVNGTALAVLMRTPGRDLDLVAGFLWTEGVIESARDLDALAHCDDPRRPNRENLVRAALAAGCAVEPARRTFTTGSSCGLCGKTQLQDLAQVVRTRANPTRIPEDAVNIVAAEVAGRQPVFERTGGLHAACRFHTASGAVLDVAEDIGRHNATDKVLGAALRAGADDLAGQSLWVSGRVSFEIVQKAAVAGLDGIVAVGAVSALAADLAGEVGLDLIGFARAGRFTRYHGESSG